MKQTIKWLLAAFAGLLLIVLVFFVWLFNYTADNMEENVIHSTQKQLDHAAYLLEAEVKEAELNALSVISDRRIRFFEADRTPEEPDYRYTDQYAEVRNTLLDQVQNSEGIESLAVYWQAAGTVITSQEAVIDPPEFYQSLPQNGWFSDNNRLFFVTSYPYVYLPKSQQGSPQYYVLVELSRYHLEEIRQVTANTDHSRSLLLMPDLTGISPENETDQGALAEIRKDDGLTATAKQGRFHLAGEDYLYFTDENAKSQLRLITYLPYSRITGPVNQVAKITLAVALTVLAIAVVIGILFYKNISQQVKQLITKFKQVENGDFDTRIAVLPKNEFGYVFDQFNQMVSGGQRLMQSLANEQRSRDAAEFKQLQFQINPHFLYNSLAYIVSISYDQEAVIDMAAHLADYYRYSTKARVATTVKEEAKFAERYLEIMAMRKNLDYTLEVAADVADEAILPLLLQPLIENAIEHGIEGKEGAHQIGVSLKRNAEGKIRVEVADDGYGLAQPEITQLLAALAQKERGAAISVGLWNVNQRLVNHYGRAAALRFARSKYGGLAVFFTFENKAGAEKPTKLPATDQEEFK